MKTKAAAYAEIVDFKKAIKHQKKAIKAANKHDWDIPKISGRLALYNLKKPTLVLTIKPFIGR